MAQVGEIVTTGTKNTKIQDQFLEAEPISENKIVPGSPEKSNSVTNEDACVKVTLEVTKTEMGKPKETMEQPEILDTTISISESIPSQEHFQNTSTSGHPIPLESFLMEEENHTRALPPDPHRKIIEPDQMSSQSAFENHDLIQKFHAKMYKISQVFVYAHVLLSTCGAVGYSVVAISSTNEWHEGVETPGWHIEGGFVANVVMINTLAVAVNMNLCFAALLIIGFHKHNRVLIWMWYLGQLAMESVITVTLVLSVFYDCKLAAMLSIPPFLYYVVSLSSFRQILATVSLNKSIAFSK